jgi:hypothetical protein
MSRVLAELFQKAQKIKSGVSDARQRLSARHVEAVSPDNMVRVVASCDKQIVSVEIKPELAARGAKEVESAVTATTNEALKKAEAVLKEEFEKTLGDIGLNFPGLF